MFLITSLGNLVPRRSHLTLERRNGMLKMYVVGERGGGTFGKGKNALKAKLSRLLQLYVMPSEWAGLSVPLV